MDRGDHGCFGEVSADVLLTGVKLGTRVRLAKTLVIVEERVSQHLKARRHHLSFPGTSKIYQYPYLSTLYRKSEIKLARNDEEWHSD
jgi:hypothetical protein